MGAARWGTAIRAPRASPGRGRRSRPAVAGDHRQSAGHVRLHPLRSGQANPGNRRAELPVRVHRRNRTGLGLDRLSGQRPGHDPSVAAAEPHGDGAVLKSGPLSWTASTDNVGVTGYDIYRDGSLIAVAPPQTDYLDQTVQPETAYTYSVVATDAAGNASQPRNTTTVSTPSATTMFYDGFEAGDMSQWTTSTGMTVQSAVVSDGTYAAEGTANSSAAYAYKQLSQAWPPLCYSTRFDIISQGASNSAYLLRLRTANKGAIAALFVNSSGRLGSRNDVTGVTTASSTVVTSGTWHTLELFGAINGTSGQISACWTDRKSPRSPALSRSAPIPSATCSQATHRRRRSPTWHSTTSTPIRRSSSHSARGAA